MSIQETHLTFDVDGMRIPAAVTLPASGNQLWQIVIVPGSGPNDVDGNYPADQPMWPGRPHTYADLARQLARRGHAVLRYARDGTEVIDPQRAGVHTSFRERVAVVAEACRILRTQAPHAPRLALAGHSEGSVVSLLLLTERSDVQVDACISLSGPAWRFFDLLLRQMERQAHDGALVMGEYSFPFDLYRRSIEAVRAGQPVPDDVAAGLPFGFHQMPAEAQQYLRDYDAVDPTELIARVTCPVLIVQGLLDTSVQPDNAERLAAARHDAHQPTNLVTFPELQHFYKRVPPGVQPHVAFTIDDESDPQVSDTISTWLRSL